ncbi:MAG: hypothetical protein JW774_13110 [Candidatus Aureabacteria bacterium]|nr:hypothetical protein [Candidatus Auribacterota bacterium]
MQINHHHEIVLLLPFLLLMGGCQTLERLAVRSTQSLLHSQYQSFLSEEDPILAREAAAGNVKLAEGLLLKDPKNPSLQILVSQSFFSYAFGYVEEEDEARASRLYLRGLKAGSGSIGGEAAFFEMNSDSFSKQSDRQISLYLENYFWSTLNFACWVNLNKSDLKALNNRSKIESVGKTIIKTNEAYYYGGGHLLLGLYNAIQPKTLGGNPERSKEHFEKCLQIHSRQFLIALYLYARYYAVAVQDRQLFQTLLKEIEVFDAALFPEQRLSNLIAKEKAKALLQKEEELFI